MPISDQIFGTDGWESKVAHESRGPKNTIFDAYWSPQSGSGYIEELQLWCLLKSKIVICKFPKWKKKFHER